MDTTGEADMCSSCSYLPVAGCWLATDGETVDGGEGWATEGRDEGWATEGRDEGGGSTKDGSSSSLRRGHKEHPPIPRHYLNHLKQLFLSTIIIIITIIATEMPRNPSSSP